MSEVPREAPEVRTRRVVALALGFVGFAILLGGGLALYYRWITGSQKLTAALRQAPAPRLQPNPTRDWELFHKAQGEELDGYGAVNGAATLVHIPIERAMALVAARGPRAYDPVEGTPRYATATGAPLDGAPRAVPQPLASPYGKVR